MSSHDSIYNPPGSSLERPATGQVGGSIEGGLAGDFTIDIGEICSEAWALTNGSKGVILGGMGLVYAITFGMQLASAGVMSIDTESGLLMAVGGVLQMIGSLAAYPISAGLSLYALRRAGGSDADFSTVTSCFGIWLPILGITLLQFLLVGLGLVLLVLPGIYLAVAYFLALPLLVDRGLGIWEALETSRKAVSNEWFRLFALASVVVLAVGLGTLVTLGIGLIWLLPFSFMVWGVVYREVFGVKVTTASA